MRERKIEFAGRPLAHAWAFCHANDTPQAGTASLCVHLHLTGPCSQTLACYLTDSRDPHAPQTGFGYRFLDRAIGSNSVHKLIDGGERRCSPFTHSDSHLNHVEASG